MTDKELRSLNKLQLLSLLHDQEEEIDQLAAENGVLKAHLRKWQDEVQSLNNVVDTATKMDAVMDAAQKSISLYLDRIRKMEEDSQVRTAQLDYAAQMRVEKMLQNAQVNCATIEARQRQVIDSIWGEFQRLLAQQAAAQTKYGPPHNSVSSYPPPYSQ